MAYKNLKEVRWGIVGAGNVCEIKSGPALQQAAHSTISAVMRRNTDKAADFARRHNVPKWYDCAEDLILDPEVNAIYIATPPDSHMEYTLMAANAGKPVYVEKPMARNWEECNTMVDACKQAEVPLFVAYYRRALPNILKIKELLDNGILGAIRFVSITLQKQLQPDIVGASEDPQNWRIRPEIAGGGYFYDLASHQLDVMDFLFGPICEAKGFALNQAKLYPAEDLTLGAFRFEGGILGQGVWAFNTAVSSDLERTIIVGSKGQLSFSFFGDHSVTLEVDGKQKELFTFDVSAHIQRPLIEKIVAALRGNGQCPSTGESAARTNRVMEQLCQRIDI